MKNFFITIIAITAIILAATAAYFSVFGLSKFFVGASMSVIVMMATLEFSKIVVVTLVNQFWNILSWARAYLILAVAILMIITSLGVYGYLSSAYSATSSRQQKNNGTIELIQKKKEMFNQEKTRYEDMSKSKEERLKNLMQLNVSQETRIDSMYKKGLLYNASRTEGTVKQTSNSIDSVTVDINKLNLKIQMMADSVSKCEMKILDLNNNDVTVEVGPLKYVAKLTGLQMDTVANILMLLLIIVFDPLAIALVITVNKIALSKQTKGMNLEGEKSFEIEKAHNLVKKIRGLFKKKKTVQDEPIITEKPNITITEDLSKITIADEINKEPAEEIIPEIPVIVVDNVLPKEEIITPEVPVTEIEAVVESNDVAKYIANDGGKFERVEIIPEQPKQEVKTDAEKEFINSLKSIPDVNNLFIQYLGILYDNGSKNIGDEIPIYSDFINKLKNHRIIFNEKDVSDFLTLCAMSKITSLDIKQFIKDYESAKIIIKLLS